MTDSAGVAVLGECGLFMDVAPNDAVREGDWIATDAGSRYLVLSARRVNRRKHSQSVRYQMRVGRLARNRGIPDGVHCWTLRWYPRGRRP